MFDCKWCDKSDICHKGATVEKNCRSCRNAEPVEDAQWKCSFHGGIIPPDFIKLGCNDWFPI